MHVPSLTVLALALSSSAASAQLIAQPITDPGGAKVVAPAVASDWKYSAGAAVVAGPRYAGASKTRTMAIPVFDIRYRDWFFINPIRGVGAETELFAGLKASASLGASFDSRKAKDDARLRGLGDVSAAGAVRFGLDYEVGHAFVKTVVISRLGSNTARGTLAEAELGYNVLASRAGVFGLGLEIKAMDSTYGRNFFGVTAAQAAASGLPIFKAGSGVAGVGPFVQAIVPVSDRWTFFGRVAYTQLRGDAAASPITVDRNQPFMLATMAYRF